MSGYDQFFEKYQEAIDAREVPQEVIKKYETILPAPIIDLWKRHGFGGYYDGLFWTINPDDYLGYVEDWIDFFDYEIYPIMRTAFADIIVIYDVKKDDKDVGVENINIRHGKTNFVTIGVEDFFRDILIEPGRFMSKSRINDDLFFYGVDNLGILKSDQCYGFEPIALLGGEETEKNMKTCNFDIHLDILTQVLGGPIEVVRDY